MQLEIVDFITPDQLQLRGLWAGNSNASTVYIFIHGLASDVFAGRMIHGLVSDSVSVFSFSNRGAGVLSRLKKLNPNLPKGYESVSGGMALEVFEESVQDIEGAIQFAKARGAQRIFLVGHSTGCHKSVFYLSRTHNMQNITGVILLAPLSDYSAITHLEDKNQYETALAYAMKEVREGRMNQLIPEELWPSALMSAQRFISLYTPESEEEIFTYSTEKQPETFRSVHLPMIAVFAGADEYGDRPAEELTQWFRSHTSSKEFHSIIIENAPHNFKGMEKEVCTAIASWSTSIKTE